MKSEKSKWIKVVAIVTIFTAVTSNVLTASTKKTDESMPMITAVEGNLSVYVKEGQYVTKGQKLFYIASNEIYPAEYKKAEHDMRIDKITYQRKLKLNKQNAVSVQAMQDALKNYTDDIDQMNYYAKSIEHGHYYAPFNGIITKVFFPNGTGIGDGSTILRIHKA
jgi:multidrug resistance efflux pump